MMLLIPFYSQALRGYSPESSGLLMLPMPLTIMIVAPLSRRLSDKIGAQGVATVGLLLLLAGLFLFSCLSATMALWDVLWCFVVFGGCLAMFMAPNDNAVMSSVPPKRRGTASGLLGTFRFTGQTIGVALAGTPLVAGASLHGMLGVGTAPIGTASAAVLHSTLLHPGTARGMLRRHALRRNRCAALAAEGQVDRRSGDRGRRRRGRPRDGLSAPAIERETICRRR